MPDLHASMIGPYPTSSSDTNYNHLSINFGKNQSEINFQNAFGVKLYTESYKESHTSRLPLNLQPFQVTILPRTGRTLGFAQYTPVDKKLYSPEELLDRMCMALGGRAAEALTFNSITTGAQNDLEKVTSMAYAQIMQFGFNEVVGPVSFENGKGGGKRPFSKRLAATMDLEAKKLIAEAYARTEQLLKVTTHAI
jgi:ATP-dependent Zn protease